MNALVRQKVNELTFILFILSFLDGFFTYGFVKQGIAHELNPLMDYLIQIGPHAFLSVKMLLPICLFPTMRYFAFRSNCESTLALGLFVLSGFYGLAVSIQLVAFYI